MLPAMHAPCLPEYQAGKLVLPPAYAGRKQPDAATSAATNHTTAHLQPGMHPYPVQRSTPDTLHTL